MQATFEINDSSWGVQVATLQRRLGLEAKQVLTDQSRLFLEQVMDLTPPKSLAQGRARTGRDIAKVMDPFRVKAFKNPRLEEIVNQGDYQAFESFMRHVDNATLRGATAGPFDPQRHTSVRNARGGVGGRSRRFFVIGADVSKLDQYVARKKKNVGFARSGWLLALWAVGGSAPSWVTNQIQRGQGSVQNALDEDDPFIVAQNRTPWADNRDEGERIIRYAVRYRVKAMQTYLKRALERAAEAAGIAVTAA